MQAKDSHICVYMHADGSFHNNLWCKHAKFAFSVLLQKTIAALLANNAFCLAEGMHKYLIIKFALNN